MRRLLGKLLSALSLNALLFLAGGAVAFADHTSGIEGGEYAQPWIMVVITFGLLGMATLAFFWALRAGHFHDVEDERGQALDVEDEQTLKDFVLEPEEEV